MFHTQTYLKITKHSKGDEVLHGLRHGEMPVELATKYMMRGRGPGNDLTNWMNEYASMLRKDFPTFVSYEESNIELGPDSYLHLKSFPKPVQLPHTNGLLALYSLVATFAQLQNFELDVTIATFQSSFLKNQSVLSAERCFGRLMRTSEAENILTALADLPEGPNLKDIGLCLDKFALTDSNGMPCIAHEKNLLRESLLLFLKWTRTVPYSFSTSGEALTFLFKLSDKDTISAEINFAEGAKTLQRADLVDFHLKTEDSTCHSDEPLALVSMFEVMRQLAKNYLAPKKNS